MSCFLDVLQDGPVLADGAMGSYIFELTGRLSEPNHVYEALSFDRPEVVRKAYLGYLHAGSRCLTTNTFAANPSCLQPLGLEGRVQEIARSSVSIAQETIAEFVAAGNSGYDSYHVLGSIGPTPEGTERGEQLREAYADLINVLISEGVDALILETFRSIDQLRGILNIIAELPGATPPLIVQMSLERGPSGWSTPPDQLVEAARSAGAAVVGINCCSPWDAESFVEFVIEEVGSMALSAMPNAGGFQHIGNRYMTRVNPEYMGRQVRTLRERGVALLGGCCDIHPSHVREMRNYLHGRRGSHSLQLSLPAAHSAVSAEEKRENGPFSRKIADREFAVSVEILPSRGTAPGLLQRKVDFVGELADSGLADALDITDGSRGIPLMPPGDFIYGVRQQLGWGRDDDLELIPHFTARDLNVMGLQARLIGYWANAIRNVLFITGDPPKMAPTYPASTAVFDFNSVDLVRYTHSRLNAGVDFGGQPLGKHKDPRTRFTIGTGFEPEAVDMTAELEKLEAKIDAGADYVMTQPAFRPESLDVLTRARDHTAVLVGVLVLTGLEHAHRMNEVPGMVVPKSVLQSLEKAPSREDQARIGIEVASEQIRWVRSEGWSGVYLTSPSSHTPVIDVLRAGLA
ncbi:MAG: homocysteine S-methyltransferase family protein [Candidatus Latescibacterota bacterium]|nr:homocysteine S-methyltransferase family protein [Candidatus Latescibacterota bacterium]